MQTAFRYRLMQAALLALPLALGVAGCESMDKLNPFAEKQTPLPGERKALFPEGVPGVEFGAAPQQPTNSNIPITPAITEQRELPPAENPPQSQARASQPAPANPPAPAKSKSKAGDPNDPWTGAR